MPCLRMSRLALADLVLILAALLGGAGLGCVIFPRTGTPATWESGGHAASGAPRDQSFAAATPDDGHAQWGRSQMPPTVNELSSADRQTVTPTSIPAQRPMPSPARRTSTQDWRLALQRVAIWTRPAEAPAGANRYTIASPSGAPQQERLGS